MKKNLKLSYFGDAPSYDHVRFKADWWLGRLNMDDDLSIKYTYNDLFVSSRTLNDVVGMTILFHVMEYLNRYWTMKMNDKDSWHFRVKGFVNYLTEQSKRVKSKRMAMLIAYVIGIIIFIDGLLSIMFTGVVTRPLIDKFKVSREKLAYICDATSAPVNALIPLNSWGAMLMSLIAAEIASGYIQGEPMNLLVRSLPFQFYSILSLLFVLFYIVTGKDWGPMKKAEQRVQTPILLFPRILLRQTNNGQLIAL